MPERWNGTLLLCSHGYLPECYGVQQSCLAVLGGTSTDGARSKKPTGRSMNPIRSTGMIGQSSVRTACETPNVCQTTTSVSSSSRKSKWPRSA